MCIYRFRASFYYDMFEIEFQMTDLLSPQPQRAHMVRSLIFQSQTPLVEHGSAQSVERQSGAPTTVTYWNDNGNHLQAFQFFCTWKMNVELVCELFENLFSVFFFQLLSHLVTFIRFRHNFEISQLEAIDEIQGKNHVVKEAEEEV